MTKENNSIELVDNFRVNLIFIVVMKIRIEGRVTPNIVCYSGYL